MSFKEELDNLFQLVKPDGSNIYEVYKESCLYTFSNKLNGRITGQEWFKETKLYQFIIVKTSFLTLEYSLQAKIYCLINNITSQPICRKCKIPVGYNRKSKQFSNYCSSKCSANCSIIRNKTISTNIKKYGTKTPAENKNIQQKMKETNLALRGVENAFQCPKAKQKIKETNLERYGVENPSQNEEVKQKIIETNLENRGVKHAFQDPNVIEKINKTNKKRYGTINPSKNEEIKQKIVETNLQKRGVEHVLQDPSIWKKIKQTNLKKYKVEYVSQSEIIKNKIKNTHLNLSRNNVYNNTILKNNSHVLPLFTINEYKGKNKYYNWQCVKCNKQYSALYNSYSRVKQCPYCFSSGYGKTQQELKDTIKSFYNNQIIQNIRSIIKPQELDIYLPKDNLAIEYNGLYWHSKHTPAYHLNKTTKCKKRNIQLIHVFEDEWINNKPETISKLKIHLNTSNFNISHKLLKKKLKITISNNTINHSFYFKKLKNNTWKINNLLKYSNKIINYFENIIKPTKLIIINDKRWCRSINNSRSIPPINWNIDFKTTSRSLTLNNDSIWDCGKEIFIKKY